MERRTSIFAGLLVAGAALFLPSLAGEFVWDDHVLVAGNPGIREWGAIPRAFRRNLFGERANNEVFRPLVEATFVLDYQTLGARDDGSPRPLRFHATNVMLHLAAAVLLYALLRRITIRPGLPETGAFLFLVHPAAAEPTAWIAARGDLLALVLLLATIQLHLASLRRPALFPLALLLWLLGLFGKLAAGPAPALVLLIQWLFFGLKPRDLLKRPHLVRYAAYLVPLLVYGAVRHAALGGLVPEGPGKVWRTAGDAAGIFAGLAILARSGFQLLFPTGFSTDYSAATVFRDRNLGEFASRPEIAVLALAALALPVVAVLLRRRAPWFAFGVLWAALAFLPVSQVVRIGAVMADRFLYVPSAGVAAALAAGLLGMGRGRGPALGVVVLCFAAVLVDRQLVWRNDLTMSRDSLRSYPRNADAWNRIGVHHSRLGDRAKEEESYKKGLAISANERYLLKNLGGLYYETRRLAEAKVVLSRAFSLPQAADRQKASIGLVLARVLIDLGELQTALAVLETSAACSHPPEGVQNLLADVRVRLGE